ncbi:MAG: arsenate reductase ArsC [Acidobacteriota bacterium]
MDSKKLKVLFLCTGNSARSILGEYLLRAADPRVETFSAGAEPTGRVHPMALEVLKDAYGIDASDASSKSWDALTKIELDLVITVCDHARDTCPVLPSSPALQVHWGSPDPARSGDEAAFRRVAAQIQRRIERFCALPIEQLGRDELAAELQRIGTEVG